MAYGGQWNSTDQVAQRAVDSGRVGRFGSLDRSGGGESQRYSVSADYATPLAGGPVADDGLLVQVQTQPLFFPTSRISSTIRSTATSSSKPTIAMSTAGP